MLLLVLALTVRAHISYDCQGLRTTDDCCRERPFRQWLQGIPEDLWSYFDKTKYVSWYATASPIGEIVNYAKVTWVQSRYPFFHRQIHFACYYSSPETRIELQYASRGHRGGYELTCISPLFVDIDQVPRPKPEKVWSSDSSGSDSDDDATDSRGFCRPLDRSLYGADLQAALKKHEEKLKEMEGDLPQSLLTVSEVTDLAEIVHDLREVIRDRAQLTHICVDHTEPSGAYDFSSSSSRHSGLQ